MDSACRDCVPFRYSKQVLATREEAQRDGVAVPTTLAEYCAVSRPLVARQQSNYDDADFYNDDDYMEDDDDDDDEEDEDEEDSGHGDL
jgi:ubiquitin-conjugating enzyme E2 R